MSDQVKYYCDTREREFSSHGILIWKYVYFLFYLTAIGLGISRLLEPLTDSILVEAADHHQKPASEWRVNCIAS